MSLWEPIRFDAETIEAAVALCAGLGDAEVSAFMTAVMPLAYDDVEARHDLARAAFFEVYRRRTPCWIYFAKAGRVVKVGRSTQVLARIAALDKQHRIEHEVLGTVRGDYREENRLHRRFRAHHVKATDAREYFWYEPIAEIINDIIVTGHVLDAPLAWRAA